MGRFPYLRGGIGVVSSINEPAERVADRPRPVPRERANLVSRVALLASFVALWLFGWLPNFANIVARGRISVAPSADPVKDSTAAVACIALLYGVMFAGTIVSIVMQARNVTKRPWWTLALALGPLLVLTLVSAPLNGELPLKPQMLAYPLFMVSLWLQGAESGLVRQLAWFGIIGALASVAMAVAGVGTLDAALGVVTEKAILFPNLLAGVYSYNNFLGLGIVMSVPALLVIRNRVVAAVGALVILVCIIWSGSRTSMIALACGVLGLIVVYAIRSAKARQWITAASLVTALLTSSVVPMVAAGKSDSFSARGTIWSVALHDAASSPVFGKGRSYFDPDGPLSTKIGHYISHGHNLFVTLAAETGIVGTLAALALFAGVIWAVVRMIPATPVPYLLALVSFSTAVFETPGGAFPFDRPNTTTFAFWMVIAVLLWVQRRKLPNEAYSLAPWAQQLTYASR